MYLLHSNWSVFNYSNFSAVFNYSNFSDSFIKSYLTCLMTSESSVTQISVRKTEDNWSWNNQELFFLHIVYVWNIMCQIKWFHKICFLGLFSYFTWHLGWRGYLLLHKAYFWPRGFAEAVLRSPFDPNLLCFFLKMNILDSKTNSHAGNWTRAS